MSVWPSFRVTLFSFKSSVGAPVVPFSAKSDFIADAFSEFLRYFLDNGATGF